MLGDGRDRARTRHDDRGHAPRRRDLGCELRCEAGHERVRVLGRGPTAHYAHRGLVPCDRAQRRRLRVQGAHCDGAQRRSLGLGTAECTLKRHFCSDFSPFFALRRGQLRFCEPFVVCSRLNSTCVQQVMQSSTQFEGTRPRQIQDRATPMRLSDCCQGAVATSRETWNPDSSRKNPRPSKWRHRNKPAGRPHRTLASALASIGAGLLHIRRDHAARVV